MYIGLGAVGPSCRSPAPRGPTFEAPIELEIQIWAAAIMDLNDVSHWQYEVSRSSDVGAF